MLRYRLGAKADGSEVRDLVMNIAVIHGAKRRNAICKFASGGVLTDWLRYYEWALFAGEQNYLRRTLVRPARVGDYDMRVILARLERAAVPANELRRSHIFYATKIEYI
jgi:hypothetical protein